MGLRENIHREPISALALRPFAAVAADSPVRHVVSRMSSEKVGAAIVRDAEGRPVGMFTEKMLIRLLSERPEALAEPIDRHMTRNVVCLRRDEPIAKLIDTMQEHKLRWVCVRDEAGRPIALSGLRGVMEYVVDYFPHQVKVEPMQSNISIEQREGA